MCNLGVLDPKNTKSYKRQNNSFCGSAVNGWLGDLYFCLQSFIMNRVTAHVLINNKHKNHNTINYFNVNARMYCSPKIIAR